MGLVRCGTAEEKGQLIRKENAAYVDSYFSLARDGSILNLMNAYMQLQTVGEMARLPGLNYGMQS